MKLSRHISDSAFLVNESRARNMELSQDRYAHLWVTDGTRRLWEDFSKEVCPHDAVELGLRNRFFLEQLNTFLVSNQDAVFINIAAGFTSYPFLVDQPCHCIEVDYPQVVGFKRAKINEWQSEGKLPERDINFLAADLTDERDLENVAYILKEQLAGRPSVIFMEGLSYYITKHQLNRLFSLFAGLQTPGSTIVFDYWRPDHLSHPVFIRFVKFFAERMDHGEKQYNLFDLEYIKSIPGYSVTAATDIQALEEKFAGTTILADYDTILPEYYAVLIKE
jgi:O-methyltransferase involved in polyketide biosynthesis